MRRRRLSSIITVIIGVVIMMGGITAATHSAAHAASASTTELIEPQGINLTIHPHVDSLYCVTDVAVPALNRLTSVQQCTAIDSDKWTFAQTAKNSSVLIDGNGQCMAYAGNLQTAQAEPCTFKGTEHFLYSATGQITTTNGKFCLQDAQASTDAAVYFSKCQSGVDTQIFLLGH
jgi:hypothetical protein